MLQLIVLVLLVILGIWLLKTSGDYYNTGKEVGGIFLIMIAGLALVFHVVGWSTVSYSHNQFVVQRESFEQTLQSAREGGNDYETAAIVKEVAEWNRKLAEDKYDNSTWFLDCYIDDRVEDLEPIK